MRNTAYAPDGPIVLGSILSHPAEPENSINRNAIVPFAPDLPEDKTEEFNAIREVSSSGDLELGLFAKWMDGMGLDLGWKKTKAISDTHSFERLERKFFTPSTAYADKALRTPRTNTFENLAAANLYMVTGVQIAYGDSRTGSQSSSSGCNATIGLDLTTIGVLGASMGPKAAWSGTKAESFGFERSTDFVYAYRVQEIFYRKNKIKLRSPMKGQTYGKEVGGTAGEELERQRKLDAIEHQMGGDFVVVGIPDDDVEPEGMGLPTETFCGGGDDKYNIMATEQDIKPWLRDPPRNYIFNHANVIDVAAGHVVPKASVVVSNGLIESVSQSPQPPRPGYTVVDCKGKYLCPGLFDAHVHFVAVPGFKELSKAFGNEHSVSLLRQPYVAAQMLHRGFTSVRDCGGALHALKDAIATGVIPGPRLFISGHALSQSGGHGDIRGVDDATECCGGHTNGLGRLCNGVPECMAAVREEIRQGADFIKIMGSGGVSTPTDAIEHLQFTTAEIRAMVECAENACTYVTAHAYTPKAIKHCVGNGVRGIEHGNFIDKETAKLMAEKGVYLTPTLITYAQMASPRWDGFLPPESRAKNETVLKAGLEALKIASEAGVKMCYGSDLLGPLGIAQTHEFALRAKALPPLSVLRSATINPAEMMSRGDSLGQIKPEFVADLLLMEQNPLQDIHILDQPETNLLAVLKDGRHRESGSGFGSDPSSLNLYKYSVSVAQALDVAASQ
ncbi:LOW QUALITY PROTEIN: Cytosine/adenosine deaminase or related metal-dependent hydrolase [Paramyrothecium foliicola]|nr:LOW QUALITY PROTEIN: Cytosine/adenosine deaminase or related metal-dependent hydrolase [Paramyrothecium foliicola]